MTTYANIKLSEIFALYGNPFTRGFCKNNFYEKIIKKHFKKVQFREEINKKIKLDSNYDEGNSKIDLINKNENQLLKLKDNNNGANKKIIKFGKLFSNENLNHKINLKIETFSINSQKKRNQHNLIKQKLGNYSVEEYVDNTKLSTIFQNKKKL